MLTFTVPSCNLISRVERGLITCQNMTYCRVLFMRFGTAWVKYALLVATVLALATPIIVNASPCPPITIITVPGTTETFTGTITETFTVTTTTTATIPGTTITVNYSTLAVTSGTTVTTTTTQVPGLSAVSIISSTEVTSSTTTCSTDTNSVPATFVVFGLTTVIILGVPLAIPEYPFGLAVLAIFVIIAYGVIRRKTRYDYS